jgi:hypothetical protein
MEVEVDKLEEAGKRGDMAGLMRGRDALTAQQKEYLKGIEADEEDRVSSDTTGKWKKAAADLTDNILAELRGMGRIVGFEEEDALGPLRRAMGRIASLNEAVNLAKAAPEEGRLRDLGRELGVAKKELMALGRELMTSQAPALAAEAHDLAEEAEDAIRASQRVIKAALRGLGVASDISETGSLDLPPPPQSPAMGSFTAQPTLPLTRPMEGPTQRAGGDVADLVCCLAGAQANDSGWPTFNGKYVEYPLFRKEWWAYRQTYHGHVRDELACRSLKERSLASSIRFWLTT